MLSLKNVIKVIRFLYYLDELHEMGQTVHVYYVPEFTLFRVEVHRNDVYGHKLTAWTDDPAGTLKEAIRGTK